MRLFHYFVDITKPDTLNYSNIWSLVRAQREHSQKLANLYTEKAIALEAAKKPFPAQMLTNEEMASPTIDEVFVQYPLDLPINTDTGVVWDGIDGVNNIVNFWLDQNRTVISTVRPKEKGQIVFEEPDNNNRNIGTLFTDRSAGEMFLVTFARMYTGRRILLKPKITGSGEAFGFEGFHWGYWEFQQSLGAKLQLRWALELSDKFSFAIQENYGIESPAGKMVIDPSQVTYIRVPDKPAVIRIKLSRFQSKFDYPVNANDFDVVTDGCAASFGTNGIDLTITGKGSFEIIPKSESRAFIGTHNFALSKLHWRFSIV